MKKVFSLIVAAGVMMGFNKVNAQKIAVVSPDEVFALMPETKKADTTLAQYQNALADAYKEQESELNEAYAKFVKDSSKMTPGIKEAKKTDLQSKITALQTKEQELNKALEGEKEKILAPIRTKMLKAIQDVAKEAGYNYVMYKEQLIVFPETEDITDKVKAKLGIKMK
jgi:outer membrane protein